MKILFLAVNAKYIHTSPAVRILNKVTSRKYESSFKEFSIKDSFLNMTNYIKDYDIIMFSCYIWNVDIMIKLSEYIKTNYSDKITVCGGPEVSYDTEYFVNYFDYCMSGEGEEILIPFLDYLHNQEKALPLGIANKDNPHTIPQYVKDLNNVPDILDTYTKDDMDNRIIYVETTRGCPFSCSYCLSSLEKGVRFFSEEYTNKVFDFIKNNKFKCIKFLDRTFNVNPNRFIKICKFLETTQNTYQFEVAAELFNEDVIDYFINEAPKGKFRLEVGIQSFFDKAITTVGRIQDNKRLIKVIKKINDAKRATVHTDLIAGLPFETLDIFKNTFDEAFLLMSEELQLGFLKMLRGTKIRNEADLYDYVYDTKAPYEIISNKFISKEEIRIIHQVEESLEFLWNDKRAVNLIEHLIKDNKVDSFFEFFKKFNSYYQKERPLHENYINLVNYLKDINLFNNEYLDDLKLDFLLKSRVKPMPFWKDRNSKDYHEKEYDYKIIGLDESYYNSFITSYYDKLIVIKYEKGKEPFLEIKNINNTVGKRIKREK